MSYPNVPDITPRITLSRNQVINLAMASIGLEELALAHILNDEGEKLQLLNRLSQTFQQFVDADSSVIDMLRTVIKKEMLLQFKLEDLIDAIPEIVIHGNIATAIGFYNGMQISASDNSYYYTEVT